MQETARTKVCFKCKVEQPIECFYRHPRMTDGHLGKCKACTKNDVHTNRELRIGYYREFDRLRGNRQSNEYKRQYRLEHQEQSATKGWPKQPRVKSAVPLASAFTGIMPIIASRWRYCGAVSRATTHNIQNGEDSNEFYRFSNVREHDPPRSFCVWDQEEGGRRATERAGDFPRI
jgi:hypothetical protein